MGAKTLLFLRHAKSDWDAGVEDDHERPLNARGREAAHLVGRALRALGLVPDVVLASSAQRVAETVARAQGAGGWTAPCHATRRLYLPEPEAVLEEIRARAGDASVLLVVGHEPAWGATVGRLVGSASLRFPTAALACVEVESAAWKDLDFGTGVLHWLLPPRVLAGLLAADPVAGLRHHP